MPLVNCPECSEQISTDASACPSCGFQVAAPAAQATWNPGIAAVLSLIIPGAGQMYKGQIARGLIWLVVVLIGYVAFIIPGLVLHVICIFGAASGKPKAS